jgi:hypothetical protein
MQAIQTCPPALTKQQQQPNNRTNQRKSSKKQSKHPKIDESRATRT